MLKIPALLLVAILVSLPLCVPAQNLARFSDIKPGMTDKNIERQALWVANKRAVEYNWKEDYKKAVIISHRWDLDLDKNGYSKGRKIHVQLYGVMPNGKCVMTDFMFKQKLQQDETYSDRLDYGSVGDMVYVACE